MRLNHGFFKRDHVLAANHEANKAVRQYCVAQLKGFCIFGGDQVALVNPKLLFLRTALGSRVECPSCYKNC